MTFLCARCGVPVRMTSLGCYGHLAPQRLDGRKPHPAHVRTAAAAAPPPAAAAPMGAGKRAPGWDEPGARITLSPFTRRALAGRLPAKEMG